MIETNPTRVKLWEAIAMTNQESNADISQAVSAVIRILADHWRKDEASLK